MIRHPLFQQGSWIQRSDLVLLLRVALTKGAYQFVRQAALSWLAYYPGDLTMRMFLAQALLEEGLFKSALTGLDEICSIDPEFMEAQQLRLKASTKAKSNEKIVNQGFVFALDTKRHKKSQMPEWVNLLHEARQSMTNNAIESAKEFIHKSLTTAPSSPLLAVTHLQISARMDLPGNALRSLAELYHDRYPKCLVCKLILAEALMKGGESDLSVFLMHESISLDVTGQVATRLWGSDHPYKKLWPERLEAPLDLPIPIDVAADLGWNRLPSNSSAPRSMNSSEYSTSFQDHKEPPPKLVIQPKPAQQSDKDPFLVGNSRNLDETQELLRPKRRRPPVQNSTIPESLKSIQSDLEGVASRLRRKHLAHADGRFPVYVVFTTRHGIETHYGRQAVKIGEELRKMVNAISSRPDMRAVLLYADDPQSASALGLMPARFDDAWELKLTLTDLDNVLSKRGEMIGAVLIVGGPEIVPFHHLPNPVDDTDIDVPSDNPYSTADENYFIPEWLVGRLPGGAQYNAEPLIRMIRTITDHHQKRKHGGIRVLDRLIKFLRKFSLRAARDNWGYTAAIWRRASLSVFRIIGPPHALLVSPPTQVNGKPGKTQKNEPLPSGNLGYFNLHGLRDASEWYGQRDPAEPGEDPDFPVALRPKDVMNGGRAPQIVFSEACYGAYIHKRTVERALALKFLASGTKVVVGSTSISYGSITSPLIAADLLGQAFWKYLNEGLVAGEAYRRAKIQLTREMLTRQGFLDGEDQKTLISFVYYGDPLAKLDNFITKKNQIFRPFNHPVSIKTVCDRINETDQNQPSSQAVSPEVLGRVKKLVHQYLPGMQNATISISNEHSICQGENHKCPTSQFAQKTSPIQSKSRRVVILSKQVKYPSTYQDNVGDKSSKDSPIGVRIHHQYARLTLDDDGKLVKIAISR